MATLTTTPPLASDSPGMLPADRTLEPACGWFVLGTWLFLTVVALGFVTLYGNRTPRWEDWFFVPFVMVAQRVDLAWLWENAQGHRVRIAKLVLCACYSLFGFNSKPILYLERPPVLGTRPRPALGDSQGPRSMELCRRLLADRASQSRHYRQN